MHIADRRPRHRLLLALLVSKYLTDADVPLLIDSGMILPGSVPTLSSIQDVSHIIDSRGTLMSLAPGTIFRSGVRELASRDVPARTEARVRGNDVNLIDITIDRSETGYNATGRVSIGGGGSVRLRSSPLSSRCP